MKRALAVFTLALLAAMAWPVSRAIGAITGEREPSVCAHMTPARMLEHPALAEEWAQALRSLQPDAMARVRAVIAEIRAAHGCTGELAMPDPASGPRALPPGHPPVRGHGALPPGHPPVQSSPRPALFQAPDVVDV
jgi:hypothetical protein